MTKKHRVLINGRFLTQRVAGVQRSAREVISAMSSAEGFELVIAVPKGDVAEVPEGVEVYHDLSFMSVPSGILWQQGRLPMLMKKLGADLLWSPCNIGPVLAKKHIVTMHDSAVFAGGRWFSWEFRAYYRLILRLLGRTAKMIITDSDFSKKELLKYGVATSDNIRVIHLGVNGRFLPVEDRMWDFDYVLTVGARDPRKNIKRLIEAWRLLPGQVKGGRRLVITGGGAKAFASEGFPDTMTEDVYFAGYVDDEKLPALYSGASAFVYPSLYEGFGLPPLEAMACGCPVIVSDAASLPEVCGDSAYYIDPYDAKSIAKGMRAVLTDEALRQGLIKNGLERARSFSWEKSAKEHLKVFEEAMEK